ncbi:hypothetical protein MMYC01_209025 [Madurella mycetomatis]|uniref:Uncharacterized protein n=1 Tax=Madurella mycetomatis TaxID=100816 RepID=A0A175VT14_9PEZI|nr:hypothetical protein MMYC01_209025 [Madurella mycetomatis]
MLFPTFPRYPTPVSFGGYSSYTPFSNTYICSFYPFEATADGGIAPPPVENSPNQSIEGRAGWIAPGPAPSLSTTGMRGCKESRYSTPIPQSRSFLW